MKGVDSELRVETGTPMDQNSALGKFKDFIERLLALRITDEERLRYADDVSNIFSQDVSGEKPMRVATVLAVIFHITLFLIVFPSFGSAALDLTREVIVIRQLARPAALAGAEGRPKAAPPKPKQVVPKPKPKFVPIPDPTPNQPDPIRREELEETPRIVEELAADLNIGDVTAPPGPPSRGGRGRGPLDGAGLSGDPGPGPGTGSGGVFNVGGGVSQPQILFRTIPKYTDDAIKAKVQGVVLLQAVIRKNGRADSFKVIRALGYGLEESAIQEIASKWRFKPGTKDGREVDVLATIEVTFNLR